MRIPKYEQRSTIPGGNAGFPHATADAFGAQVGAATANLGKTIASTMQSISSDFKEYQDKADASNAGFALSDAETTASVETMKAEHETPPEQIGGYADRSRARVNEIGQEMLAKVPPSQQQRAQLHWRKFSNNAYERAYKHEQGKSEDHWSSRVDEQVGKAAGQLEKAPEDLAGARLRLEENIAGLPMPDWKKRQMLGAAMPALVHGAMQGYAKKLNPIRPEDRPIGPQRDHIILQMQNLRKSMDGWGTDHDTRSRSDAESVVKHAQGLGVSPRDLAAVMSYETAGTMDPNKRGGMNRDGSGKGSFLGLIQFSPENQRKYNVTPGMTFDEQMVKVSAYLKDRGLKPGHGLAHMYSIINAGSLDKGEPRWNAPDANDTLRNHVGKVAAGHYPRADKFLGEVQMADAGGGGDGRVQIAQAGGAPVAGSAPVSGGAPVPGQTSKQRAAFSKQMDAIIEGAVNNANAGDDAEKKAVTDSIANDTVQIKMTGKESELNALRVERAFGPQFAEQWNNERQASRDFHAGAVGMEHLSEADRRARVQKALPQAGDPAFARRMQLYEELNTKAETISKSQKDSQEKFGKDMLKELYGLRSKNELKREHVEVAKSFVSPAEYEGLLNSLRAGAKVDDASAVRDLQDNLELPMPEFLQLAGRHLKDERIKTETFGSYMEKNRTLKRDDMPKSPSLSAREFIEEKHKPVLGSSQTVDRLLQDAKPTALRAFDDWAAENPRATRAEAFKVADEIVVNSQNNIFRGLTFGLPLPRSLTGKTRDTITQEDIINATQKLTDDHNKKRISDADYQTQAGMLQSWFEALGRNPTVKPAQSKPSAPSQAPPGAPGYKPTRKE